MNLITTLVLFIYNLRWEVAQMATEEGPSGGGVVAREKRQRSMNLSSTLVAVLFLFMF